MNRSLLAVLELVRLQAIVYTTRQFGDIFDCEAQMSTWSSRWRIAERTPQRRFEESTTNINDHESHGLKGASRPSSTRPTKPATLDQIVKRRRRRKNTSSAPRSTK